MSGKIWDRFCKVADREGDKTAIIDAANGQSLSYRELSRQAFSFAAALKERDEHGIVFVGEPDLSALPLLLACAAAGRCFVPLSAEEPEGRLLKMLSHLPAPMLIANKRCLRGLATVEMGAPLNGAGLQWQISEGRGNTNAEIPFLVTHSSGTTGRPKAIVFTQDTKFKRTNQTINLFDITASDVVLSATPLHHSLGQRHFLVSVMSGATLVKACPFNSDFWIQAVCEYGVTFAIPVSTHLKILQSRLLSDREILSSFRCIVTSSAPAEPEFKRAILDGASFSFWEIYGMSETACATAVQYFQGNDTKHLGIAVEGSAIRINAGSMDGIGEIEVLSDCICDGYWGDDDRWENAMTKDGYFRSGDLGRLDGQGNLIYLGRLNEGFQCGGLVVFPCEIENVITQLPQISDCIAFGLPDPIFGELVSLAYIAEGILDERDLIEFARTKLPKHMWPTRLFRCDTFPLLSSGKVDRQGLAKSFSKG